MSTDERALTDFELDRLLGRWFAEGPETVSPHVAENAVAAIATTRQVGHRHLGRPSRRVVLAWAAVLVALSVVAATLAGGSTRDEEAPSPRPSAPISAPPGMVMFRDPAAGYQFLMPSTWAEVETRWTDQGARRFVAPDDTMSVTVSYGTTEGGGGDYVECEPWPWTVAPLQARCDFDGIRYQIPFDREEAVAHLPDTLQPIDGGPITLEQTPTTLDGATAFRLVRALDAGTAGARTATYVMSIHDYRPIVLFWDAVTERTDPELIERMRASFRFLSGPPAQDPMALVPFRDPAGRYELLIPAFWRPADATRSEDGGETLAFAGGADDYWPLRLHIGGPGGAYRTCATTCRVVTVTSLTDLDDAIVASPNETMAKGPDTHSEATLGGEPARIESADFSGGQAWGAPTYYAVYTIHDGRAVVLMFDHWAIVMDILPRSVLDQMIASFRFLDDDVKSSPTTAASDLIRYTDPQGRYAVSLPSTWTPRPVLDGGATIEEADVTQFGTAVDREYGALTINFGRPDGSLDLCQGSLGGAAFTFCRDLIIGDLDALAEAVVIQPDIPTTRRVEEEHTVLGGEPARMERPTSSHELFGPERFEVVYAIHDGTPVVLAFDHWTIRGGKLSQETLRQILESFEFLDPPAEASGSSDPGDAMDLVRFTDPRGRFELLVPRDWTPIPPIQIDDGGDSVSFVDDPQRRGVSKPLSIRTGGEHGVLSTCDPECREVHVETLDDIDAIVDVMPSQLRPGATVHRSDASLDAEPARVEWVRTPWQSGGLPAYRAVYAVHRGQATILLFDHWIINDSPLALDMFDRIVASFRFLDRPAATQP